MNYYPETKEIKDVCVLDERSRFWNAPNLTELVNIIKEQIEEKKGKFIGTLESQGIAAIILADIAFMCENPKVIENRLYVDVKILETPKGKFLKEMIETTIPENLSTHFRFVLSGIGTLDEDMSVRDYQAISVYLSPVTTI